MKTTTQQPVTIEAPAAVEDLIPITTVANWLQVSCATVRSWVRCGELVAYNRGTEAQPRYLVSKQAALERLKRVRGWHPTVGKSA